MTIAGVSYAEFLRSKSQHDGDGGFEPLWLPDFLFDFQRHLVGWAVRRGRAAVFASCGLGKTPIQLVWAENVVRRTNRPVLLLTPLAVASQTVREAEKFGVEAARSRDGKTAPGARVVVTNYDQLHKFSPGDFAGCVCDESACIKDLDAKRTSEVTEFLRVLPYRLLCSATPAPNDYDELGTSSEALGELGYQDMLGMFFKQQTTKDHLGWGRTKYRLKGHAEHGFWRWVCSWARACRRPSDLGCDDGPFLLPPLETVEHVVEARTRRGGFLFDLPAVTMGEQREERRRTIAERVEKVAELVSGRDGHSVCWCELNAEGDALERAVPGAVQVSGSDPDPAKEEKLLAFQGGQIKVLVSKPVIAAWGLNWQHCDHQAFFPTHSYEQYHQAVHRSHRFGQTRPVRVDLVTSEGEAGVLANLTRKAAQAEAMFDRLVALMCNHQTVRRGNPFTGTAPPPPWLVPSPELAEVFA